MEGVVDSQEILLSPLLAGYESEQSDKVHVFVTEKLVEKPKILSMWMSPMDFSDEGADRKLHFIVKNIGNTSLTGLSANVYYVEADHEGVPGADKHVIDGNYIVGDIAQGETKEIVISGTVQIRVPLRDAAVVNLPL